MRNHKTLAVVISSMLMAAAAQAQPAPTDTTSGDTATTQSQIGTSGTMSTTDSSSANSSTDAGTTTTTSGATTTTESPTAAGQSSGSYDADQSTGSSDASAMAQQHWREADTDRNGTLSKTEMQTSMPTHAAKFSKMDANGDGQLSQDEMHKFKKSDKSSQWSQDFKSADTDRDGSVTLAEAQNGLPTIAPHFSTIDADKDGKLSSDEMAAHQRSLKGASDASMDADTGTRNSTSTTTTTTESNESDTSGTSNR